MGWGCVLRPTPHLSLDIRTSTPYNPPMSTSMKHTALLIPHDLADGMKPVSIADDIASLYPIIGTLMVTRITPRLFEGGLYCDEDILEQAGRDAGDHQRLDDGVEAGDVIADGDGLHAIGEIVRNEEGGVLH